MAQIGSTILVQSVLLFSGYATGAIIDYLARPPDENQDIAIDALEIGMQAGVAMGAQSIMTESVLRPIVERDGGGGVMFIAGLLFAQPSLGQKVRNADHKVRNLIANPQISPMDFSQD